VEEILRFISRPAVDQFDQIGLSFDCVRSAASNRLCRIIRSGSERDLLMYIMFGNSRTMIGCSWLTNLDCVFVLGNCCSENQRSPLLNNEQITRKAISKDKVCRSA
jgi:hypothetical protein